MKVRTLALEIVFPIAVVASAGVLALLAQDWPQWRGPNRDGTLAPAYSGPKTWPEQLKQKWQINVGSGHSSPLLVNSKVFLHTRQGEEEAVSCFDFNTGRQIWRDSYPAPYAINPAAAKHGKGPKSTPVYYAGKLCTLGIGGILSCYDAGNGRLQWRAEFSKQYPNTSPLYGVAASPLIDGGLVIAPVGGHDRGALAAFALDSGKPVWNWSDDGPAYASPVLAEFSGVRQVVTQSQKNVIGISLADGRLLWSIPFKTAWDQNSITPVLYKGMLIYSGLDKGVAAVKIARSGGKWAVERVWENSGDAFYMSTPIVHGDILIGMSHKSSGRLITLDARTGKALWSSTGREGDNASFITAGDKVYILTSDAELRVMQIAGSGLQPVRRYTVAKSSTWAHPVIAGSHILAKDENTLTLWSIL
jgi:outer membrane protein assembly factor BamB